MIVYINNIIGDGCNARAFYRSCNNIIPILVRLVQHSIRRVSDTKGSYHHHCYKLTCVRIRYIVAVAFKRTVCRNIIYRV